MPGEKKAATKPTKSAAPQAMEVVLEDSINIVRMTKLPVFLMLTALSFMGIIHNNKRKKADSTNPSFLFINTDSWIKMWHSKRTFLETLTPSAIGSDI